MKQVLRAASIITFLYVNLFSQENNYWNIQYGTRSTLLGGLEVFLI